MPRHGDETGGDPMTEAELQANIVDLARWAGYLTMHIRNSRKNSGVGFPDLVLLHQTTGRLLFAELKSDSGKPTPGQWTWLNALWDGGHSAYLWRPADWTSGEIRNVLLQDRAVAA